MVEGAQQWAELGRKFLTIALQEEGIGGKVAAGYGYFVEEETQKAEREAREKAEEDRIAAEKEKEDALRAAEEETERNRIETERFNRLSEAERFVCELNEAVEAYQKNPTLNERRNIVSQRVNMIIKSKGWSQSEKQMGFNVVSCACALTLNAKDRKKKIEKANKWLEG
ncbi:MAG: hypothetical protein D3908_02005 [Candidatus Electrothrix sp. AUS4]|nr:hypothetical protein [Candidatus Electrothrix sp. AUS4]